MGALATPRFTVKEYLELDRAAELKSEYHDGEMFPIAAVSFHHAQLVAQTSAALYNCLRGRPCTVACSPIRVRVSPSQYVYPDILVICGKPQFTDEHVDTITNPKVIVEVLSPSTADYDSGGKFRLYRRLESFQEYLLVAQDEAKVEVYRKQSEASWNIEIVTGLDGIVKLDSVQVEFPLSDLYEGVFES